MRYLPTGHLVYALDGTLLAVPFDVEQLTITGGPVALVEGVAQGALRLAQFDYADDGTLVYQTGGQIDASLRTLVWVDRQGTEEAVAAEPQLYQSVQLSPNGQRVVTRVNSESPAESRRDLEVYDLVRETPSVFTFDPAAVDTHPIFSTDGARIVWASDRNGPYNIFSKAADGAGQVEHLMASENDQSPYSWSPDGQALVMMERRPETGFDIGFLSMNGEDTIDWLLEGDSDEVSPDVSPDGRWMAYVTNASGQFEVIVQPFPNVHEGRWKISQDGGVTPQWGPDSSELFFQTRDGAIMVAEIITEPAFSHAPRFTCLTDAMWSLRRSEAVSSILTPAASGF